MRRFETRRTAAFLCLATSFALGCAKKEDADNAAMADSAAVTPAPAPPAAAPPSDAQIAHIVVTANTIDIDAGKIAESKGTNADVKAFGKMMVTDHSAVNKSASDLATKLSLTPEDNPTSQSLLTAAQTAAQSLSGKTGADYDKAYIANEVAYHQNVLDAIDNVLIPNAQNAELKALLEQTRPAVAAHLTRAQQLQQTLGQ